MFKMLFGNLLFFGILFGWYLYTDGDRSLLLAGTVLGFGCFLSGIFMGYILHTPPKRRAAPTETAFTPILSEDVEETSPEAVMAETTANEADHMGHRPSDVSPDEREPALSPSEEPEVRTEPTPPLSDLFTQSQPPL